MKLPKNRWFWIVSIGMFCAFCGWMEHLEKQDDNREYSPAPRPSNSAESKPAIAAREPKPGEPLIRFPGPFLRVGDGPVGTSKGENLIPTDLLGDPFVMRDGDRFRMWFTAGAVFGDGSFTLGTCHSESPDGLTWTSATDDSGKEPRYLLSPNRSGWDAIGVETVSVLHTPSGKYHLYYVGDRPPEGSTTFAIGLATSEDGIKWKKHGSSPVLAEKYEWEKPSARDPSKPEVLSVGGVLEPSVIYDDEEKLFKMWYVGLGMWTTGKFPTFRMGYATSKDGIEWEREAEPVLDKGPEGAWDELWVSHVHVIADPHHGYHCFYFGSWEYNEGVDQQRGAIGHAYSEDGVHWERNPNNPILEPRNGQWDAWSVQGPAVLIHNNEIWLWYFGSKKRNASLRAHIGVAKFRLP
ncbi:MAG: hypothetical protein CMO80_18650 [Verrucomicrobiales bacterium]|nr:hypothetical protein [Verrucomicrobiales bacterium]